MDEADVKEYRERRLKSFRCEVVDQGYGLLDGFKALRMTTNGFQWQTLEFQKEEAEQVVKVLIKGFNLKVK